MRAWVKAQLPVGNDLVTGSDALLDDHSIAQSWANRYRSWFSGLVGLDHIHQLTALSRLNCLGRHNNGVAARIQRERHIHELAGPKQALIIIKRSFQPNCSRRGVNRVVDDGEDASE